ncbi:MAG: hypothetical protein NTX50_28375 [Candidatus Sumerlaeota bacterium]|nr:hypothetical protein [Candidatus Sumerlaeota bacterium]
MSVWNSIEIEPNRVFHWRIGPWRLWIERMADEWRMATSRAPEEEGLIEAAPSEKPPELEWRRWLCASTESGARLMPAMPDRPVVVRPASFIQIVPGNAALFYISVPVFARVMQQPAPGSVMLEEPTAIMTGTWFGDLTTGQLCYGLRTRARRAIEPDQILPHRAICLVRIENATAAPLDVERLCLNVAYLRIYEGRGHLWTNQTNVLFKGKDQPSHIDYNQDPPAIEGVGAMLAESHKPVARGLLQRSLDNLISATGLGF